MKKFFKIFGIILIVLVIILVVTPYFFKDKILNIARTEINNRLDAKVEIESASLSMFRNFPNLYIGLKNIVVVGKNEFQNDTLASVSNIHTTVNLFSAISGEMKIKSLGLEKTTIHAIVLKSGKANWDIMKNSEEEGLSTSSSEESSTSSFKFVFKKVTVNDFALTYHDAPLNTKLSIDDLNFILSGDFSAKATNLDVKSTTDKINFEYNEIKYLKNVSLVADAVIGADFEQKTFTLKKNKIGLNNLFFSLGGTFGILNDGYNMNLEMKANRADFKSLLAMIPDIFKTGMKGLETAGKFEMTAFAKGIFKEDNYPAFGAKLNVENAFIKYSHLPESVDRIKIDAVLNHPQGDLDLLTFDINKFAFEIAKNPFDAAFHLKYPISDPLISGTAKGIIDFKNLQNAIPMDDVSISGKVNADIVINGRYSDIEKEEYQKFNAKGKAELHQFTFKAKSFPQGVFIDKSILTLTSRQIALKSLKANIGKSDFGLSGNVSNYIPYFIKGKTLKGNFKVTSKLLDINEFLSENNTPQDTAATQATDSIPLSIIEVPANLDLRMTSTFGKIRYDKMDITNVNGLIVVKNAAAKLTNLSMNMLKGDMRMSGLYSTKKITKPNIDFNLDIKNFDINSAYNSISTVKKMVPIAMNCNGKVSTDLNIESVLDEQMKPIPTSLNGKGSLHSRKILINDNKALNALGKVLKNQDYSRISVEELDVNYVITNGNITVEPFTAKVAGHQATISGTQTVDGKLDFTMMLKLPKEELGSDVNGIFDKLPGMNNVKALDVGVKIVGTAENPKVKVDLKKAIKQAEEAVAKELKRRAKKKLEKEGKKLLKSLFK